MKISIITATFNSEKTLPVCMDSVLNQSYSDIEYILVDGLSTDNTKSLIEEKSNKNNNIIFVSEADKGIYDALNKGIQLATGDVIGFVHSDDYLADSTTVSDIVEAFMANDADGVYGDLHYIDFDRPQKIVRNWRSQMFKNKLLNRGWMPAHPTLFLKKEVYEQKGKFNLDYRISADYDFILRVFKDPGYRFYYLPKTITKMRVGGASNKNLKNIVQKTKEDYHACKSNQLPLPFKVIFLKNFSKITQWFKTSN